MQEAGVVLHLARSGRLIVKANAQVRDGSILVDVDGRRTCKVIENIGPVSAPYLSAQPLTDRLERLVGKMLYLGENQWDSRGPRFRSNKSGKKKKSHEASRRPRRP